MIKYRIKLTESEREELKGLLAKGHHAARKLTRARVLLLSDEGKTEEEIVSALDVGAATVERLRKRCALEGVEAALVDRPRAGTKLKLDERQRARLIAEVCSTPGEEARPLDLETAGGPGGGAGTGRVDQPGDGARVPQKTTLLALAKAAMVHTRGKRGLDGGHGGRARCV